ncbi:MAG TPA: mechanosensitive ion channel family protein [Noviherbaspirillum sp.]
MIPLEFPSYGIMLAATVFVLVLAALLLVKAVVVRQLRRLAAVGRLQFLGYAEQIVNATRLPFMLWVSLLAAVSQLQLTPVQDKWLQYAWIVILVSQVALWINRLITVSVQRTIERHRQTDPAGATHLMLAGMVGRIVLWSIALLVALDNLGFNITTLMASLGIGGIAVALATQNILGDVFSSVSIALDKPFVIGDFIIVDEYLGTVEYVGMKTTRIRSLGGEQIVFSNTELLKARIRNYKRMQERRVVFEFRISYDSSVEQVEAVPALVRQAIERHPTLARYDRAHFSKYGENALHFEVVYYMLDPDYNKYMDVQQAINLDLMRSLRDMNVAFAYPTRTLHIASVPPAMLAGGANHDPGERAASAS